MLSTTSQPVATGTVLRRKKDCSRVPVECPDSIILYNKYMGGVDRGDQLRGYYCCRTKSRKFYKYLFYFLFDVAITNAFILYKHFHSHPSKSLHTVKEFRLKRADWNLLLPTGPWPLWRTYTHSPTPALSSQRLPTATSQEEQTWQVCLLLPALSQEDGQLLKMSTMWSLALP